MKARLIPMLFGAAAVTMLSVFSFTACSQGEGDVCQIDSDCKSPFVCSAAGLCQRQGAGATDAGPSFDAEFLPDAMVDAAPDAAIDASFDAPPPDAAP